MKAISRNGDVIITAPDLLSKIRPRLTDFRELQAPDIASELSDASTMEMIFLTEVPLFFPSDYDIRNSDPG